MLSLNINKTISWKTREMFKMEQSRNEDLWVCVCVLRHYCMFVQTSFSVHAKNFIFEMIK